MTTYAVQGIFYFFTHPQLLCMSICPILLTIVAMMVSVICLFGFALAPQAYGLEDVGVPDWLAWILAVIIVIIEVFVVTIIYKLIVDPCYQDKIFDQVLINRGFGDLVENEDNHTGCIASCFACCRVTIWLRILLMIVMLPINLIPVVGTIIYAWANGYLMSWEYHQHYFELKGYDYAQQKAAITYRKLTYSSFGMQAMYLEMIPLASAIFLFTNTVGAALFAADCEEEERKKVNPTSAYGALV